MAISAFIMAGGRSSRMGTDKAWLRIGEQFVIERVIEALKPVADDLAIVANKDDYSRLGPPVFPDVVKEYGPLGGIHVALSNAQNDRVLIVACDLPFVSDALFEKLIEANDECDIVVPLNAEGKTEQMCALYSRGCLPVIESLIEQNVRRPRSLFERCRTKYLNWSQISELPGAIHFFDNLNTPEDYVLALRTYAASNGE